MSRLNLIPVLFIATLISASQCHKDSGGAGKLKGKLVIDKSCAHYVIQVLDGNISPDKVVATWTDTIAQKTYTNVFTAGNRCGFAANDLAEGDIFTFDLDPTPPVQNCMICLIYYPSPPVVNAVKNVKKIGSGS